MKLSELIAEYLEEHTKYKPAETFCRYKDGRIMSEGMERELNDAKIFAKAALSYVNDSEVEREEKLKIHAKLEHLNEIERLRLLKIWRDGWERGSVIHKKEIEN